MKFGREMFYNNGSNNLWINSHVTHRTEVTLASFPVLPEVEHSSVEKCRDV